MSDLLLNDQKYLLNIYNRMSLEIEKAEGSYLYDVNGNKYLDMFSGIAVNAFGHHHDKIKEAITKQMEHFIHLSNYFAAPSVVNLAKLLVDNSFASKVFFCNSGTEANEAALKAARKYGKETDHDKIEVIALNNSFHGRTFGGLSLTGQDKYKKMFMPMLPGTKHVNFNDIKDLQNNVSHKTCAIFLEIIQGEGGVIELSQDYVNEVVRLSKIHDFLIIIDEIQTGLCRTGDLFAFEHLHLKPDVVTIAKSLGGGLPIGAMLVSEKLENIFNKGEHGTTFGGNPLAASVGEVILKTITKDEFKQDIKAKGNYIIDKINLLKEKFPSIINNIRGRGLMIGIDTGCYANQIKELALNQSLLLNVTAKTIVRLLPPLTISYKEIDEFLEKFENSLELIK